MIISKTQCNLGMFLEPIPNFTPREWHLSCTLALAAGLRTEYGAPESGGSRLSSSSLMIPLAASRMSRGCQRGFVRKESGGLALRREKRKRKTKREREKERIAHRAPSFLGLHLSRDAHRRPRAVSRGSMKSSLSAIRGVGRE